MDSAVDWVAVVVVKFVGDYGVVEPCVSVHEHMLTQILSRTCGPCRHKHNSEHLARGIAVGYLTQSVEIHVDAFVPILTAARCGHDERVVGELYAGEGSGHIEDGAARCPACGGIFVFCRNEIELKSVWRYFGTASEQLLRFSGCHLAHGGEAVGIPCGGFFKRVLALHIEFGSHLVAIVIGELVVKRLAVAAYAAAYARSVSCEHSGHAGHIGFEREQTHCSSPFVEMGHNFAGRCLCIIDYAFDDHGSGTGKGTAFVVVAVSVQRVNAEEVPHAAIGGIFRRIHAVKLHEHCHRLSGHIPAAYAHTHSLGEHHRLSPALHERLGLSEIRRRILF